MDATGGSHYFDRSPQVHPDEWTYRIDGPAGPLSVISAAGVFSHGSLDKATALLLDHIRDMPEPADGALLDLGCGAGPIALLLAARFPGRTVYAVDTNDRAIDLCSRNATANGLANIIACRPEDVPTHVRVSFLCSNPPIRIGKENLHALLREWFGRLAPDGTACMVVGKNLGADSLQSWLTGNGWPTERASSAKGFRILVSRVRTGAD